MQKSKYLIPYFFITISFVCFHMSATSSSEFIRSVFTHIDYLFTDVNVYQEENYLETNYSVFSDQMICNQVSLIKIYPEFEGFQKEAERRGIKCFKYNLNNLYFYSSLLWFQK